MTIQMGVRVLHFTLLYSLTRKPNFRCTATSVSRKILLCFCEPSQTFTPFWRVTFSEHFLKEWSFTFFGKETSNLVDGNISIEKNVFTTQRIISCEDFCKRVVSHKSFILKVLVHTSKKKTISEVWRCCLLKSKIKYQPSKDLKTFSSVELVFFFESTFQATLHKMRNFEKFSQIIDCGQGKVLHKIAWSIVCIDRRRFQKTLRQITATKEFGFFVDMRR